MLTHCFDMHGECVYTCIYMYNHSLLWVGGVYSLSRLPYNVLYLVLHDAMCDAEYRLSGQRGGCAGAGDCQTSGGPLQAALTGST